MKDVFLALALLAVVPSCQGWQGVWVEATEEFEMDATGASGVECDTHNGAILVQAAPGRDRIAVKARKKSGASTQEAAEKAMQAIEVTRERRGGQAVLGWRWREENADYRADVAFEIQQPAGLTLRAETHNGAIGIGGPVGDCRLTSHNGNVTVSDWRGKLVASTHNGAVYATGALGQVEIETHNGAVVAVATAGSPSGSIQTHNGNAILELAAGVPVELDCATDNGTVSCGVAIEETSATRTTLTGKRGSPSGRLTVRTHNGSIRIGKEP